MPIEFLFINGEPTRAIVKRVGKHYIIRLGNSGERYVCRRVDDEYICEMILPEGNKKTDREVKDSLIVDDYLDSIRREGL